MLEMDMRPQMIKVRPFASLKNLNSNTSDNVENTNPHVLPTYEELMNNGLEYFNPETDPLANHTGLTDYPGEYCPNAYVINQNINFQAEANSESCAITAMQRRYEGDQVRTLPPHCPAPNLPVQKTQSLTTQNKSYPRIPQQIPPTHSLLLQAVAGNRVPHNVLTSSPLQQQPLLNNPSQQKATTNAGPAPKKISTYSRNYSRGSSISYQPILNSGERQTTLLPGGEEGEVSYVQHNKKIPAPCVDISLSSINTEQNVPIQISRFNQSVPVIEPTNPDQQQSQRVIWSNQNTASHSRITAGEAQSTPSGEGLQNIPYLQFQAVARENPVSVPGLSAQNGVPHDNNYILVQVPNPINAPLSSANTQSNEPIATPKRPVKPRKPSNAKAKAAQPTEPWDARERRLMGIPVYVPESKKPQRKRQPRKPKASGRVKILPKTQSTELEKGYVTRKCFVQLKKLESGTISEENHSDFRQLDDATGQKSESLASKVNEQPVKGGQDGQVASLLSKPVLTEQNQASVTTLSNCSSQAGSNEPHPQALKSLLESNGKENNSQIPKSCMEKSSRITQNTINLNTDRLEDIIITPPPEQMSPVSSENNSKTAIIPVIKIESDDESQTELPPITTPKNQITTKINTPGLVILRTRANSNSSILPAEETTCSIEARRETEESSKLNENVYPNLSSENNVTETSSPESTLIEKSTVEVSDPNNKTYECEKCHEVFQLGDIWVKGRVANCDRCVKVWESPKFSPREIVKFCGELMAAMESRRTSSKETKKRRRYRGQERRVHSTADKKMRFSSTSKKKRSRFLHSSDSE